MGCRCGIIGAGGGGGEDVAGSRNPHLPHTGTGRQTAANPDLYLDLEFVVGIGLNLEP